MAPHKSNVCLWHSYIAIDGRGITDSFKQLSLETIDSPSSSPRPADGMAFLEKMALWASMNENNTESTTAQANPEIEGLEDDDEVEVEDDEDEPMPELRLYRKIIEESAAYRWLLGQIQRKTILNTTECDIRQYLRKSILDVLPARPAISRRNPMELIQVRYEVHTDFVGFLKKQQYEEELSYALENAVIITGSKEVAQAETCIGYLRQTWPVTGESLLQILKAAVDSNEKAVHTASSGDGSTLIACLRPGRLIVTAFGSRDSVIDVGEQLAWLGSGLQYSSLPQGVVCSLAEISGVKSRKLQQRAPTDPSVMVDCSIRFKVESHTDQSLPTSINGSCWHGLFLNPVIVAGFPIPKRDDKQLGLEISLSMMAKLAQAKRLTCFDGRMFVKGFSTMLLPTERSKNIISWHLLYNKDRKRLLYIDSRIKPLQSSSVQDIQIQDIENARHILGWASSAETFAGAPEANYNIRRSGLTSRGASCVLERVSVSVGKLINADAKIAIGRHNVPLHLRREGSYVDQIRDAYNNYVMFYDVDDRRPYLVNGATALLHIVRASLHEHIDSIFGSNCLFKPGDLREATVRHNSKSAVEVLTSESNMELKITRDKAEIWTETTSNADGSDCKVIEKRKEKFVYFQDCVDEKWSILEQMLDHQSKMYTPGLKLTMPGRQYLEGYDFADVASRITDIQPRCTKLNSHGKGWVDFTRSIRAITLFGRGFGELIRASQDCNSLCSMWLNIPKHLDYLTVSVSDLEEISKNRGNPSASPMELVDDICWYQPDKLFESCNCKGTKLKRNFLGLHNTCDRVQVLLPSTSRIRRPKSHGPLENMRNGAVIFGHSKTFSICWPDHDDPSLGVPDSPTEEPDSSPNDSGLGSSIPSSSSEEQFSHKRGKRSP